MSPLISSSILDTYWPGDFIFQCPIFLPFHTIHGFSRQEYWSSLPFPSAVDHVLSEMSTMTCPFWWPYTAWLIDSLSQTRQWSMWSDWLVFCDFGFQSVCPLMKKGKTLVETESSNMLKGLYTMANLDLSHNARVVPHMKINQCNSLINLINQIMETHTNKIILIEAEKAFDETENPFMMITLNNSEIVENFLKIKKRYI